MGSGTVGWTGDLKRRSKALNDGHAGLRAGAGGRQPVARTEVQNRPAMMGVSKLP
jgi:hypothetical protein